MRCDRSARAFASARLTELGADPDAGATRERAPPADPAAAGLAVRLARARAGRDPPGGVGARRSRGARQPRRDGYARACAPSTSVRALAADPTLPAGRAHARRPRARPARHHPLWRRARRAPPGRARAGPPAGQRCCWRLGASPAPPTSPTSAVAAFERAADGSGGCDDARRPAGARAHSPRPRRSRGRGRVLRDGRVR